MPDHSPANGAFRSPPGPPSGRHVEVLGVRIANLHTIEAVAHMEQLIWSAAHHARALYIVNAHTLESGLRRCPSIIGS